MSASVRSLLPELGSDPVAAVRAGVPTAALDRLQSHLQVSDARLAPMLGVSSRTLRRRRTAGTLTPDASDRLVGLGRGHCPRAAGPRRCRPRPRVAPRAAFAARGETPLDRMDMRVGMKEVTTMLAHVEHGMPV
jgi:hypothetical protein